MAEFKYYPFMYRVRWKRSTCPFGGWLGSHSGSGPQQDEKHVGPPIPPSHSPHTNGSYLSLSLSHTNTLSLLSLSALIFEQWAGPVLQLTTGWQTPPLRSVIVRLLCLCSPRRQQPHSSLRQLLGFLFSLHQNLLPFLCCDLLLRPTRRVAPPPPPSLPRLNPTITTTATSSPLNILPLTRPLRFLHAPSSTRRTSKVHFTSLSLSLRYLRTSLLSYLYREPLQFFFLTKFAHWGLARFFYF